MVEIADHAGILLGVVSQHRFDESIQFLAAAVRDGRLGKLIQCDAYVKWHRTPEYYARAEKGSWATDGGGALISQAIHQVDLLRWIAGPIQDVFGMLADRRTARHRSRRCRGGGDALRERRDGSHSGIHSALAWISRTTRISRHERLGDRVRRPAHRLGCDGGRRGTAPARWQSRFRCLGSDGDLADVPSNGSSRTLPQRSRQVVRPLVAGEDGYEALAIVDAIYRSCRSGGRVRVSP